MNTSAKTKVMINMINVHIISKTNPKVKDFHSMFSVCVSFKFLKTLCCGTCRHQCRNQTLCIYLMQCIFWGKSLQKCNTSNYTCLDSRHSLLCIVFTGVDLVIDIVLSKHKVPMLTWFQYSSYFTNSGRHVNV